MGFVPRCKHFTGYHSKCCKVGINYEQLAGGRHGMALRLPCHETIENLERIQCDKFVLMTEEDVKEPPRLEDLFGGQNHPTRH